jgi:gliding motility-associated-like protein
MLMPYIYKSIILQRKMHPKYLFISLLLFCTLWIKAADAVLPAIFLPVEYDFPNAFSPDGDGNNDYFRLLPGSTATLETLQIYNRAGELVFDNKRDGKSEWDGKYQGKEQPVGTYVFYSRIQLPAGGALISDSRELLLVR